MVMSTETRPLVTAIQTTERRLAPSLVASERLEPHGSNVLSNSALLTVLVAPTSWPFALVRSATAWRRTRLQAGLLAR